MSLLDKDLFPNEKQVRSIHDEPWVDPTLDYVPEERDRFFTEPTTKEDVKNHLKFALLLAVVCATGYYLGDILKLFGLGG